MPATSPSAEPKLAGHDGQEPSSSKDIDPFPPTDPKGYIHGAQVEFIYAFQMLEVLRRLSAESERTEMLPVEGLYGLFCAIQSHVGAGSNGLQYWQEEYAVQGARRKPRDGGNNDPLHVNQ